MSASSMILKTVLSLAVLSLYLASAQRVKYIPCKGVTMDATINEIDIIPCPSLPCQLKRGTNVTGKFTFTMGASTTATNVTTVVHGIIGQKSYYFPTKYKDACKTTGIKCPLKPGDKNVYTAELAVLKLYPAPTELYVKWEALDQNKKDVFCFEIPAEIV